MFVYWSAAGQLLNYNCVCVGVCVCDFKWLATQSAFIDVHLELQFVAFVTFMCLQLKSHYATSWGDFQKDAVMYDICWPLIEHNIC